MSSARRLAALAAAIALAGCTPLTPQEGQAYARPQPRVVLVPAAPCPGTTVAVTGSGAPPGEPLEAWLGPPSCCGKISLPHPRDLIDFRAVATATADAQGVFAFSFPVPDLPATQGQPAGRAALWLVYGRSGAIAPMVDAWACPAP